MSVAITVRNLSKRYRIGVAEKKTDSLIGQVVNTIKTPIRNLRSLRRLSSFKGDEDSSIYWALKDVCFDVFEGEVLGIIGHNGAGKSTLLKILSRITEPTNGEIQIRGRVSSLLEVGTGFHPDLTGRENVYMNGTILGMRKREIDSKFDEIVEFSGVAKYIDTPVKRYSSGMKVRLGFSVAAHLDPQVLIIDEVLAVGDSEFQTKCIGKMRDVAGHGRTVLFVSHQMGAISRLTNRCVWLNQGQVKTIGDTASVVRSYLSHNSRSGEERVTSRYFRDFRMAIVGENGETRDVIDYGSFFSVKFSGLANDDMHNVVFFYRIENSRGEILCTYSSRDDDKLFDFTSREAFAISHTTTQNVLIPGLYYVTFAVHDRGGAVLEALFQVGSFEVTMIGAPNRFSEHKSTHGFFYAKGGWNKYE